MTSPHGFGWLCLMRVDPEARTLTHPVGATWRRPALALCFMIAVAIVIGVVTNWFTVPIVLGFLPADAPSMAAVLLGGAMIPALVLAFRFSVRSSSWPWMLGALRALVVVTALVTWALIGLLWFVGIVSPFSVHVLAPSGPDGCRIVVRETSFTWSGSGMVYALPAGHAIAKPVSWYGGDDGLRPVSEGLYELSWLGAQARLNVHGTKDDPVWPSEHHVGCA